MTNQGLAGTTLAAVDQEAEQGVLGTLLGDPGTLEEVAWLRPDDFQIERHQWIFDAIARLAAAGKEANLVTVPGELQRAKRLWTDGSAYLSELVALVPSFGYGRFYAERVRWARRRQALASVAQQAAKLALSQNGVDPVAKVALLTAEIEDLYPDPDDLAVGPARYSTWQDLEGAIGPIEWDWPGWLPKGFATMIAAEPGIGKSVLALRLAAVYLLGWPWPDGTPYTGKPGRVLWCETEGGQALNLARATAWGLPTDRILTPTANPLDSISLEDYRQLDVIRQIAAGEDVRLIVVDSFSGGNSRDENDAEAGRVVKAIAEVARDAGLPLVITHHLNKSWRSNRITLANIRGSTAIAQYVRLVWAMDKPDPENMAALRLYQVKNNLAALAPGEIGQQVTDTGMVMLAQAPEAPKTDTVVDRAVEFLLDLLQREPLPKKEVERAFEDAGLSMAALRRAENRLNLTKIKRSDGPWIWSLPVQSGAEKLQ